MKKCSYADKYKAIYAPRCGGKDGPCEECSRKWALASKTREDRRREQASCCAD